MTTKHAAAPLKPFKSKKGMFDGPYAEYDRKGVCKRCGKLMRDCEPPSPIPEFHHKARVGTTCVNDNTTFYGYGEIQPFMRKRDRRAGGRIERTR